MKKRGSTASLSTYSSNGGGCHGSSSSSLASSPTTSSTSTGISISIPGVSPKQTIPLLFLSQEQQHDVHDDYDYDDDSDLLPVVDDIEQQHLPHSYGNFEITIPTSSASSSSLVKLESAFTHQRRRTVLSTTNLVGLPTVSMIHPKNENNNNTNREKQQLQQQRNHNAALPPKKTNSNRSTDSDRSLKPADTLALLSGGAASAVGTANNSSSSSSATTTTNNDNMAQQYKQQAKAMQLCIGAAGIYGAYLYYGLVQEDLFRYRSSSAGAGFTFVWALQVLESAVTMSIGFFGRRIVDGSGGGRHRRQQQKGGAGTGTLPLSPFFQSGASQLAAKAFMSLSLTAGLSFPVVTLAKSAKIVPVMLGQLCMGGSSYSARDYAFAILIVVGTALLSAGNTTTTTTTTNNNHHTDADSNSNTLSGLVLIFLSLTADGFTGGLQKKLKRVTASMAPTTYDFLYYSHMAQLVVALVICTVTGELWIAPRYLSANPAVWWFVLASCVCSAVGQCFIFYVISCFDPLVCTTITTTRKVLTVVLSISFKGHDLTGEGCLGLGLACTALLLEVEGQVAAYRKRQQKQQQAGALVVEASSSTAVDKATSP